MEFENDMAFTTVRPISQSEYFPWQRASRTAYSRHSGSLPSVKSHENTQRVSVQTNRTACSSVCRHSWNKKNVVVVTNTDDDKKKQKLLTVLKMQVKMRESSLNGYKKRYKELVRENLNLKEEITSSEDKTYKEAKELLECYKKFRGAVGTLNKQYSSELTRSREEFEKTKEKILKDIQVIKIQVDELTRKLSTKNTDVNILLNYKDKEYLGKALQIAKLKRQRERLMVTQKEELEELRTATEEDRIKRHNMQEMQHENTRCNINEIAVRSLDTNVKEMILQNVIMKKEIKIHQNEIIKLKHSISRLESEIRQILLDKNLNPAEQLFPDIFREEKRCLPQDTVHLDIPLQTWLPI